MSNYQKSIGREAAIALFDSKWWIGKTPREIAKVGLLTAELCLPFDILQNAVEKALGRPVFTHEFALNFDGIVQELIGERDAPTLQQIIELIPADKRYLVSV